MSAGISASFKTTVFKTDYGAPARCQLVDNSSVRPVGTGRLGHAIQRIGINLGRGYSVRP